MTSRNLKNLFVTVSLAAILASPVLAQDATAPKGQVLQPQSPADVPTPVAGAPITPEYVAAIGRMAYLWAWPMVNMRNR